MLEFLNITINSTINRFRNDWGSGARDFMWHNRRYRGWSIEEEEPPVSGARVFDIVLHGVHITHCSLCLRPEAGDALWRYLLALPHIVLAAPTRPSHVPWLAVHLLSGAIDLTRSQSPRMLELADLETAVAWDMIDRAK